MPREDANRLSTWERRADLAWKWALRIAGLAAFAYVLIVKGGSAPIGAYVLIGGLIGLPNVIGLQQLLNDGGGPHGSDGGGGK